LTEELSGKGGQEFARNTATKYTPNSKKMKKRMT